MELKSEFLHSSPLESNLKYAKPKGFMETSASVFA